MIAELPLLSGAFHDTTALPSPAVAVTSVGAPGTVSVGVTAVDAAEGAESPAAFVATTVKVYAVPLVRPGTVADVAPAGTVTVCPSDEVTV